MNEFIPIVQDIAITCKYTKWYCNIIVNALNRKVNLTYTENHHILPKSFKNHVAVNLYVNSNIVKLTAKEHFICHLLLTKMFTGSLSSKMNFAFFQLKLSNKHQQRYYNSRFYDTTKKIKRYYTRLYKLDKQVYVDSEDKTIIDEYIQQGWSLEMTPEFKPGRVGNMKGKQHTPDVKLKMSLVAKQQYRPWFTNQSAEQRAVNSKKAVATKKLRQQLNPDIYNCSRQQQIQKLKDGYKSGLFSRKGENNPRYGVVVSADTRQKMSDTKQRKGNAGLTHKELYDQYILPQIQQGTKYKDINLPIGVNRTSFEIKQIIAKFF